MYTQTKNAPEFINKQMDKKALNKLLSQIYLVNNG